MQPLVQARQIKIGVIDTGIDMNQFTGKICTDIAPINFVKGSTMDDNQPHGTMVAQIIADNLKDIDYCIVPIKFYDKHFQTTKEAIVFSIYYAEFKGLDVINMSQSGDDPIPNEKDSILRMLANGQHIIAAAGNENINLDNKCTIFPVCYSDKVDGVGALNQDMTPHAVSNYSKKLKWEVGENVEVLGVLCNGTSFAAPQYAAKVARRLYNESIGNEQISRRIETLPRH